MLAKLCRLPENWLLEVFVPAPASKRRRPAEKYSHPSGFWPPGFGPTPASPAAILSEMRLRIAGVLLLLIAAFLTFNFFRPIPAVPVTAAVAGPSTTARTVPSLPRPEPGSAG